MTAERRESMLTAVESPPGFDNLKALVQRYLDEGIRTEHLLEDLSQIRALVPDDVEEVVLDVMDLLVGWCAPEFMLVRKQKDELGRTSRLSTGAGVVAGEASALAPKPPPAL